MRVTVRGAVPAVEAFSYDPPQNVTVLALTQTREGGTANPIDDWATHHYTNASDEARDAIDTATRAIESARERRPNPQRAENARQNAIDAYEGRNFELATTLSNEATDLAESAERSAQRDRLLLFGGVVVVVLAVVVVGVYWFRRTDQPSDRLG